MRRRGRPAGDEPPPYVASASGRRVASVAGGRVGVAAVVVLAVASAGCVLGGRVAPAATAPRVLSGLPDVSADYREFLDAGRTPALAVAHAVAASGGFTVVDPFATTQRKIAAGDRLVFVNRGRSAIFAVVGERPIARAGVQLIGAHLDTPSPRLALHGLGREGQARLTARAYGGMRIYQWAHRPLAIVGRVARAGGAELDVALGLDDDFAFYVAAAARTDETLRVIASSTPTADAGGVTAVTLMRELHRRYGLTAADLEASELYLVPKERAREVGLDRSMIGAHGQDDRANSWAAWRAIHDLAAPPPRTALVWLVDREEVGSRNTTGAESRFLELVTAWLLRAEGAAASELALQRAFAVSDALSADCPAAIEPSWPEVHEVKNAPVLGGGPAMFPFTGRGGKSGGASAGAEAMAHLTAVFAAAKLPLQFGELGRVDEGGGGTIADVIAQRGIDTVDIGVAVVSMHSPFEVTALDDLWTAYRGYRAWLETTP